MTQEEKYKEALLEARAVLGPCLKYSNGKVREALDSIDKELKSFESEDERIRKTLVEYFGPQAQLDFVRGVPIQKIRAWLEKQEVFSKNGEGCYYYADGSYTFIGSMGFGPIEDIKINGERPKTENKSVSVDLPGACPCAEKQKEPENTSASTMAPSCWQKEQKPNYCHYGGDPSVERCKYCSAACSARLTEEQKPEWSDEDEKMLDSIIKVVCGVGVQPNGLREKQVSFLKSLRPQYHGDVTMTEAYKMGLEAGKASSWKPSEEQMNILKAVKDYVGKGSGYWGEGLGSLIDDLEKLM